MKKKNKARERLRRAQEIERQADEHFGAVYSLLNVAIDTTESLHKYAQVMRTLGLDRLADRIEQVALELETATDYSNTWLTAAVKEKRTGLGWDEVCR